jgi:hypothetical protein
MAGGGSMAGGGWGGPGPVGGSGTSTSDDLLWFVITGSQFGIGPHLAHGPDPTTGPTHCRHCDSGHILAGVPVNGGGEGAAGACMLVEQLRGLSLYHDEADSGWLRSYVAPSMPPLASTPPL